MRPRTIPIAVLGILLLAACGGSPGRDEGSSPAEDDYAFDYAEIDQLAEEEINAPNAAEARAWLAAPGNLLFEGSKEEVVALTDRFYRAGCPQVYMTGIESFGGTPVSASMVVVLPSDPDRRREALAVENEFSASIGEDGVEDRGQRYLFLAFD